MPCIAALTYLFVQLRPQDRVPWERVPLRDGLKQALQGSALGAGAFLALVGIGAAKGWISTPVWGWEQTPIGDVLHGLALQGTGHLAIAFNEEVLFRGYGFDTLREALGPITAAGVLIVLFALIHGTNPQVLLGQSALGSALTLLRLKSDGIWLPLGYHWAWNLLRMGPLRLLGRGTDQLHL